MANLLLGRGEDAVPWLQRSIAVTPASGRSRMLVAAAYQEMGRIDEAKVATQEGPKLRPGATALNVAPPMENVTPLFAQASDRVVRFMIAAGLPAR